MEDIMRIGEMLYEKGLITTSELRKALEIQKKQGGKLGSILIAMDCISVDMLVAMLSKQQMRTIYNLSRQKHKETVAE